MKIFQQAHDGPVDLHATRGKIDGQVAVVIPVAMAELNEPHTRLHQAPGMKTLPPESIRLPSIDSIERQGLRGFTGEIHHLQKRFLHAESQLEGLNGALDLGLDAIAFQTTPIQGLDIV